MTVAQMFDQATPEVQRLVTTVLEHDAADRAWSEQLGPALTQADAALLLGKSEQATAKDRRLLRIKTRSGRVAYPIVQFEGRRTVEGLDDVLRILAPVADPLTIAAWLTGTQGSLGDRRPVDALRAGEVPAVLLLARRLARSAA